MTSTSHPKATHTCPKWLGYLLLSPIRRWQENPDAILGPHITKGMTVLEVGPAMGFFTLTAAKLVGTSGRVITVDVQPQMLEALKVRAQRAGVLEQIDARCCHSTDLGVQEPVDFGLLFHVVHEVPDQHRLFTQLAQLLKPGCKIVFAEPRIHVRKAAFLASLELARSCGFTVENRGNAGWSRMALLKR